MKELTCSALGGPCDAMIQGADKDELMKNGMDHLAATHPEMVEGVKNMSKEDSDKWKADFNAKWDAAPEMPAAAPTTPEPPASM